MNAVLRRSAAVAWVLLVASIAEVGFGMWTYHRAFTVHLDAPSGLVYAFVPIYQWGWTLLIGAICAVLEVKSKSPEGSPPGS